MELSLEDFFEHYPSQDDPEVQKKLAEYFEFQECESGRQDVKLENDTFYTQQRAYQRLGYAFRKIALIAEAGVGKTGCNICLSDYLKNTKQARKNYFITGASQVEDFRNQLVYGLSNSYHMAEKLQGYEKSAKGLLKVINKMISDFYSIMTYDAFVKYVLALSPATADGLSPELLAKEMNQRIDDEFTGCSIFFDEFQFLKITSTNISKVSKGKGDAKVKGLERDRHRNYWTVWRVCQVAKRTRITIASARPITIEPMEFGYAMNWILPLDMQIRLNGKFQDEYTKRFGLPVEYGPSIDWKNLGIESTSNDVEQASKYYMNVLEPYLRGRVMFVAAADTGVIPTYLPLPQPTAPKEVQEHITEARKDQLKRMKNAKTLRDKAHANLRLLAFMKKKDGSPDIQAQTYMDYIRGGSTKGRRKELEDKNPREILTAVFPKIKGKESIRNWGIEAMRLWLTENYTYREDVVSVDGKKLKWYLQNSLQSLSITMWYIRNVAVNYPWKGYVFSDIVEGSGVYLLGLALEEGGDVFINGKRYGPFQKYVPGELNAQTIPQGQLGKHFLKYPRYAIISSLEGSGSSVTMARILSLYNHPDNIHGEYLKYILLSRKGMTGINLMGVMYVFSLFLSHNPSDLYQAIMRAFRANSHQALREIWLKDPMYKDLPFEVSINLLTAVFADADEPSISVSIADRTLNRDLNIAPIVRAYKQRSVTAWIFKERNNLSLNQIATSAADYMSNTLKIPGKKPNRVIYNNYLLLYCDDKIQKTASEIIDILRREGRYDILSSKVEGELESSIFYLALSSLLVENNYGITDQFGFLCDVVVFDTMLYLNRKYSSVPQGIFSSYYTTNLIAVESRSLSEIIDDYIKSEIYSIYDEIISMPDDVEVLSEYIGSLKIEQKALFLESIIAKAADPNAEPLPVIFDTIIEMFMIDLDNPLKPGNLIDMEEPIERIQRISERSIDIKDRSRVFVHNIYVYSKGFSGAGKMSRTSSAVGRIRIFRLKEGVWRDTRDDEAEVYRFIFTDVNNKRNEAISRKSKIYGKINEGDDKFWIIDKRRESEIAGGNELITGTATIQRKIYIVAYMWELGIRYDEGMFRDYYSYLFDGINFDLTKCEVESAITQEKNLSEVDRKEMITSASILRRSEMELVNKAERKYGKANHVVIVYAVRKKMMTFAIEKARKQLWDNYDKKAKGYNTRTFYANERCYTFNPEEDPDCLRATSEMVIFFYHYLHSQSRQYGHPKEKLMQILAMQMHRMGLIYSDSLDDTGIRAVISKIYNE